MRRLTFFFRSLSSLFLWAVLLLAIVSCQPICQKMEPTIICQLPSHKLKCLPSAFPMLSSEEKQRAWGKEILIGDTFAREADFYRAITCYKRALILLPTHENERRLQIDYDIMLCYYLGGKYGDVIQIFEESDLSQANPDFPAFKHLVIIVYDSYLQIKQEEKAACALEVIRKFSTETAEDLLLYQKLKEGKLDEVRCLISEHRKSEQMAVEFAFYDQFAKSPKKARTLNALLPGAGYYYLGQRRSAMTSFIINALFTAAAYQFFRNGYYAAGAFTTSLEMGWYIGGINGAGIEAQQFNTRLFEGVGRKILNENDGFPILMFETSF